MSGRWSGVKWVVAAGLLMGVAGSLLSYLGNPVNTGVCVSCFLENTVGALGLHNDPRMWYARPELMGFFLGSFAAALARGEFKPRSGGTGFAGLGLGVLMIVGSAVFIGCPIKAFLRLAGGDLTSLAGIGGLVAGVWAGLKALSTSDMGLAQRQSPGSGPVAYGIVGAVALVTILAFWPGALRQSAGGGGSLHAPVAVSLLAGLLVGAACQGSRFCVTGQVRDVMLTRRLYDASGLAAFFLSALLLNAALGLFNPGYADSPGVHLEWWWSFAGMALTGWAAVVAGGCPFRQIVKAGEGDLDAATITAGMCIGAVLVETWGLASSSAGTTVQGRVAVLAGFAALFALVLAKLPSGESARG